MLVAEMPQKPRTWPLARPDLDGFVRAGGEGDRCLLLHGFTASPREVLPLADALALAGFTVRAVRLPGHATHVADLEQTSAAEWIAAAEAALKEEAAAARDASPAGKVLIAGQSMGALLSLLLAARHPDRVRGVASLAAPMWLASRNARWMAELFRFTQLWRLVRYVPKGASDLPPDRLPLHFTYDRFPVRGVLALQDVIRAATRALPSLSVPLLVVHGALDRSAPPEGARRILALAGSASKELVELPRSHHLLTLDVENDRVCAAVVDFFTRIAERSAASLADRGTT